MGFKPLRLSQNIFQLLKNERRKPWKVRWWDSNPWLIRNYVPAYEILRGMSLNFDAIQNCYPAQTTVFFILWFYWGRKPSKFRMCWPGIEDITSTTKHFPAYLNQRRRTFIFKTLMGNSTMTLSQKFWWDLNRWHYQKILSSLWEIIFSILWNIKGESLQNSGFIDFMGFKAMNL